MKAAVRKIWSFGRPMGRCILRTGFLKISMGREVGPQTEAMAKFSGFLSIALFRVGPPKRDKVTLCRNNASVYSYGVRISWPSQDPFTRPKLTCG